MFSSTHDTLPTSMPANSDTGIIASAVWKCLINCNLTHLSQSVRTPRFNIHDLLLVPSATSRRVTATVEAPDAREPGLAGS
jgi:hypothetical protein